MTYTSAEAAKLVRTLNEEQRALIEKEGKTSVFVAAVGEDVEDVRPVYNYEETQKKLKELEDKVRKVKHAINLFNMTTVVPGFDMTVDQMLVYIPQLNEKKAKLNVMAGRLPKERDTSRSYGMKTLVEYQYANYDVAKAEEDLKAVTDELARAHTALDVVNTGKTLEIDF